MNYFIKIIHKSGNVIFFQLLGDCLKLSHESLKNHSILINTDITKLVVFPGYFEGFHTLNLSALETCLASKGPFESQNLKEKNPK